MSKSVPYTFQHTMYLLLNIVCIYIAHSVVVVCFVCKDNRSMIVTVTCDSI